MRLIDEVTKVITSYEQLPIFLTVKELAEALKVGRSTAYELVRSNKIHCYRAGTQYRIPKESIRDLLSKSPASFR